MNKFICLMFVFLLWGCSSNLHELKNVGADNFTSTSENKVKKTPIKKEYNKYCILGMLCNHYSQQINYNDFIYDAIKDANRQGIKGNTITDIQIKEYEYINLLTLYLNKKITLTGNIFEKE